MYAAIVPTVFTSFHTFRSYSEKMTREDEEICIIGLVMIVLIACVEMYVDKIVALLFVLPPFILVVIGPLYQRIRYKQYDVKKR